MSQRTDLTGQKFGKWTVLKRVEDKNYDHRWLCKCECGKEKELFGKHLKSGVSKGCSTCIKRNPPVANLVGRKFGKLTVTALSHRGKAGNVFWFTKCDCGNTICVSRNDLKKGEKKGTNSCGCMTSYWRASQKKYEPRISSARSVFRRYKDGDLTFDDFMILTQQPCSYCQRELSNVANVFAQNRKSGKHRQESIDQGNFVYNGLDRLDSKLPHNKNNVIPCCKWCNHAKSDMTPEEFQNWLKRTAAHHLYEMTPDQLDEAVAEWKAKNEKAPSLSLGASSELALVS